MHCDNGKENICGVFKPFSHIGDDGKFSCFPLSHWSIWAGIWSRVQQTSRSHFIWKIYARKTRRFINTWKVSKIIQTSAWTWYLQSWLVASSFVKRWKQNFRLKGELVCSQSQKSKVHSGLYLLGMSGLHVSGVCYSVLCALQETERACQESDWGWRAITWGSFSSGQQDWRCTRGRGKLLSFFDWIGRVFLLFTAVNTPKLSPIYCQMLVIENCLLWTFLVILLKYSRTILS